MSTAGLTKGEILRRIAHCRADLAEARRSLDAGNEEAFTEWLGYAAEEATQLRADLFDPELGVGIRKDPK